VNYENLQTYSNLLAIFFLACSNNIENKNEVRIILFANTDSCDLELLSVSAIDSDFDNGYLKYKSNRAIFLTSGEHEFSFSCSDLAKDIEPLTACIYEVPTTYESKVLSFKKNAAYLLRCDNGTIKSEFIPG